MTSPVTKDTTILTLLESFPETRQVFAALGMGCLDCLGANLETVETGARMHGLDVSMVLSALNRAIGCDSSEKGPDTA